jgi:regulator of sigma E protease
MNILLAVLGISVLVIVHEAGHYFSARAFGMRVLKFSVGFGPTIAKWQPKGSPTVFQVGLIPFLAYVQIAGMNPHEENEPDDPELYQNKGVFARFVTIFAGPFANYMIASLLVLGFALSGYRLEMEAPKPMEPMTVENVQAGSPAQKAGVKAGDVIREADGKPVRHVLDLIEITGPRAGKATVYGIERDGKRIADVTILPEDVGGSGKIGIVAKQLPRVETRGEPMPAGEAIGYALAFPFQLTMEQLEGLTHMVKKRSTEGFVGPVGMVKIVASTTHSVLPFARMMILISVALGMFNLFPLPALDGGRLVFLGYEIITKRRANEQVENLVHTVGLVFLLCMIALVTLRDVAG